MDLAAIPMWSIFKIFILSLRSDRRPKTADGR